MGATSSRDRGDGPASKHAPGAPALGSATAAPDHAASGEIDPDLAKQAAREAAERSAERKVLARILPMMFLFSLLNYIDRSNLAFAAIPLKQELGFNNEVFGLASGVFFASYAGLQIPAQLLCVRLGGPRSLAALAVAWGVVSASMAAVRSEAGMLAQRVLLGAAEAGALPAMWMINAHWFPTYRLTIPSTCVMMAITVAQAISAPLAAGLLSLHHRMGGLSGWQVMFLLEGLPAVILGACIGLFLPRSIAHAKWLTPEEREAWAALVASTDARLTPEEEGGWRGLRSALSCRVVYCAGVWRGFYATALYGLMYFSPLIIKSILPDSAATGSQAALLSAAPYVCGAVAHAANALHSSRSGERRWHIAGPWLLGGAAMALVPVCLMRGAPEAGFAVLVIASIGINSSDGPDVSWVTSLMSGRQRALGLATVNMLANIGGFVGPYVVGALSTATGSFSGPMWFVAGCIVVAGSLVALFPVSWANHNDTPVMQARRDASLVARQFSGRASGQAGGRPASGGGAAASRGGSWGSGAGPLASGGGGVGVGGPGARHAAPGADIV